MKTCRLKLLFIMNMTAAVIFIQLLCTGMLLAHTGKAQTKSLKETTVDLKLSGDYLKEGFLAVEKQTNFIFSYDEKLISKQQKKISYTKINGSVEEFLLHISGSYGLKFKRVNDVISVQAIEGIKRNKKKREIEEYDVTISGKITDENGEGLPGASVVEKGTSNGAITDLNGNYRLSVQEGATLVISFIGYTLEEIEVNGRSVIDLQMTVDITSLSEVVVVGYGTTSREDLTGSVGSVKTEELNAYPASGTIQALQGRVAGLQVQSTNGEPGGGFKVRVRGATSINASSDPLFVVDGFVSGVLPPQDDIASVDVLKDASATAIYGSRGANGVILITTKKGSVGTPTVNFNTSYSAVSAIDEQELLNADQYIILQNELRAESDPFTGGGQNTDWQDLVLRDGSVQNYQLSVAGGSEKVKYYVSGVFYQNRGLIKESDFKRYSITSNLEANVSERFKLGLNLIGRRSTQDGVRTQEGTGDANGTGVIMGSYLFDPTLGIRDDEGNFTTVPPRDNPVASLTGRTRDQLNDEIQTNLSGELDIINGLVLKTTWGAALINRRQGLFTEDFLIPTGGQSIANLSSNRVTNLLTETFLSYNKEINGNEINATAGYSYQSFSTENFSAQSRNFIDNSVSFYNLGLGNTIDFVGSNLTESQISSFYARLNYNYESKYFITFTNRYDGSSVLSEGNQWKYFPSGAIAWNIANEEFFQSVSAVSYLKLRASYGITGNQSISPYSTLARFSNYSAVLGNQEYIGLRPSDTENRNLTWEETTQLDIGIDLGLFDNRINVTADYYNLYTEGLLFRKNLPSYSGFSSQLQNIGEVSNRGIELVINTENLKGAFEWNTSFNISSNEITIEQLPEGGADIFFGGRPGHLADVNNNLILREGEAPGAFYGYVYQGVISNLADTLSGGDLVLGGEKFQDIEEDGILDDQDRQIIGDPNPDFIWGLNNDFRFAGFDLNIFLQAVTGNDILNLTRMELETLGQVNKNSTAAAADRWAPGNEDSDFPRALAGRPYRSSSRWIEDGSFIRLKNIALGYSLPKAILDRASIRSLRIYVSAQNLVTITKYKGVDPEIGYQSSNTRNGLDYGSYPNSRLITFGLNLGL